MTWPYALATWVSFALIITAEYARRTGPYAAP